MRDSATFATLASVFEQTRAFIFDLDGVLYRGEDGIPGAAEAVAGLRARRPAPLIFFLTNNSSQTRADYVAKLSRLGIPCHEDEIVTSASAAGSYLVAQGARGRTVLCVGGIGIRDEMTRAGLLLVPADTPPADVRADFLVVGMDRQFNYDTLYRAQQAVLHGASFIATNRDGQYPIEHEQVTPGGGAMVAAIEACTDTVPLVMGKPETLGLQTLLDRADLLPDQAVMIGDRLDTDVLCGNRLGVPTVLVLTGVTSEAKLGDAPLAQRPGLVLSNLRELL